MKSEDTEKRNDRRLNEELLKRAAFLYRERRLQQIGIDFRRNGQHKEMLDYLNLLREEIRMTEEFLAADGCDPRLIYPFEIDPSVERKDDNPL